MRTQIIRTKERLIVKIDAEIADPARAIRRAEKKLGVKLVQLTYQVGPILIFSDRWNSLRYERANRRPLARLSKLARALQSRAAKYARRLIPNIDSPRAWQSACAGVPTREVMRARLCARYALNPHACTVAAVTPRLP